VNYNLGELNDEMYSTSFLYEYYWHEYTWYNVEEDSHKHLTERLVIMMLQSNSTVRETKFQLTIWVLIYPFMLCSPGPSILVTQDY
jgi:hypothetical protein